MFKAVAAQCKICHNDCPTFNIFLPWKKTNQKLVIGSVRKAWTHHAMSHFK